MLVGGLQKKALHSAHPERNYLREVGKTQIVDIRSDWII